MRQRGRAARVGELGRRLQQATCGALWQCALLELKAPARCAPFPYWSSVCAMAARSLHTARALLAPQRSATHRDCDPWAGGRAAGVGPRRAGGLGAVQPHLPQQDTHFVRQRVVEHHGGLDTEVHFQGIGCPLDHSRRQALHVLEGLELRHQLQQAAGQVGSR